jgi:putative endonuclease
MMKHPAVYMLASQRNGTLYIGVTSDLVQRIWQHREGLADGFTKQYGLKILVWYEQHETMESAISREKAMKKWLRKWKLATIEKSNPDWVDLWPAITGAAPHPVLPTHAGNEPATSALDSRMRGNDEISAMDSRLRGNDD